MHRAFLLSVALAACIGWPPLVSAQIVVLDSFDPSDAGGLCGLGLDPETGNVWVYACSASDVRGYSATGDFLASVPRPGESANDVDVEFAPEPLTLGTTALAEGTLLFVNGESGPAEIYAVDKATGSVIDTLPTDFGVSHVVGGAYHPARDAFFLVQDNVPGSDDENRIAEIDPASGSTLSTFQITATFDVSFGDVEVSTETGNLFVVSSNESSIAEYTPEGDFVAEHALPAGVSSLSGIALDCAMNEAWVAGTGGTVWHLGQVPCGFPTAVEADAPRSLRLLAVHPNPLRTHASLVLTLERPQHVRVALYDALGREAAVVYDGALGRGERVFALDGSRLPSGLYVVRVDGEEGSVLERVVRLR